MSQYQQQDECDLSNYKTLCDMYIHIESIYLYICRESTQKLRRYTLYK